MFSWLGSRYCVFPSVLADYKPALPANVGWEAFSFMHHSKLGPEKWNCFFDHKCFKPLRDHNVHLSTGRACVLLWWWDGAHIVCWGVTETPHKMHSFLQKEETLGNEKVLNEGPQGLGSLVPSNNSALPPKARAGGGLPGRVLTSPASSLAPCYRSFWCEMCL